MTTTRFKGPIYSGPQWAADGVSTVNGGRNAGNVQLTQTTSFIYNPANAGTNSYLKINLPDNAQITGMYILVTTAFAGSTATNVSIGVQGTATFFTNAVDIQGGGVKFNLTPTTTTQAGRWNIIGSGASNLPLMITVAHTGVATAGAAYLVVEYVQYAPIGETI